MPKFTIVATDYEYHVDRSLMREGINSITGQNFKDFELLIIHDGPKNIPYDEEIFEFPENTKILNTDKHYGIYEGKSGKKYGWGHHSRKLGIEAAEGEYIINFNIDNILYSNCLYHLNEFILFKNYPNVIIYPIEYRGVDRQFILPGQPPRVNFVDLLQCVAKKSAWESIGGFKYFYTEADGMLIEELTNNFGYSYLNNVLAVNR